MTGSFCGRPAFIGKSVFGRKTVGRQSLPSGTPRLVSVVSGASAIARGSSGGVKECKPRLMCGFATPLQPGLGCRLLLLGADVAVWAKRGSDGPDVVDPDIALERGRDLAELLRQRQPHVRVLAVRTDDQHPRADLVHPLDGPVGPAPERPLIVERDDQRPVAAALGDNRGPAIEDIVPGAVFGALLVAPRPGSRIMGLDPVNGSPVAVEDIAPRDDVPPRGLERRGEQVRLARASALEVEDDRRRWKRVQRLLQRGDRALLLAPEGEGLPAVGRVAIA